MGMKYPILGLAMMVFITSVSGYLNFEEFERQNAGITPKSPFYTADRIIENTWKQASFSDDSETIKKLNNIQERGDEIEALTWLNMTGEARDLEEETVLSFREMREMIGGTEKDTREQVREKMRAYAMQWTNSRIYPYELGYKFKKQAAETYVETYPESDEKIEAGLEISEMYADLVERSLNLNMTGRVSTGISDYNQTVNRVWEEYEKVEENRTQVSKKITNTVSNHTEAFEKELEHISSEFVENKVKNVTARVSRNPS